MAASKFRVGSIICLGADAAIGYFNFDHITQENDRRAPDWEEAFRLYREGARLGDATCCGRLGACYLDGTGTAQNLAKRFKWCKVAAEKGDAQGMGQCAHCYNEGNGTEIFD
jgi:TPR repeat protein